MERMPEGPSPWRRWTAAYLAALLLVPAGLEPAGADGIVPMAALKAPLPLLPAVRPAALLPPRPLARPLSPALRDPARTARYDALILEAARRRGLDPRLVKAVIAAESEFNPDARSFLGARGLMQLLPPTAEEMGVPAAELADPARNVEAGTAYLEHLFARAFKRHRLKGVAYRDAPVWITRRVIASYHAGPRYLHGGRRIWPAATIHYVAQVERYYRLPLTRLLVPSARFRDVPSPTRHLAGGLLY